MTLTINRDTLLEPLQQLTGVVERKQTLPILSHVCLQAKGNALVLTATDLEIELVLQIPLEAQVPNDFEVTLQARKLLDIVRSLPEAAMLEFYVDGERMILRSGRSRFILATLPVGDFPRIEEQEFEREMLIPAEEFIYLLQRSAFAMASQDVRYYLNGMFMQLEPSQTLTVATDGHRLALNVCQLDWKYDPQQLIIPRKSVSELLRLIPKSTELLQVRLSQNHLQVKIGNLTLTSKLIDGRFPNYKRLVSHEGDKIVLVNREALKQALARTSILSNEKFRGIRLQLRPGILNVSANNPNQEEAEEIIHIDYEGDDLDIGFNVGYLLDAINVFESEQIKLTFKDQDSSVKIEETQANTDGLTLVMPIKLV